MNDRYGGPHITPRRAASGRGTSITRRVSLAGSGRRTESDGSRSSWPALSGHFRSHTHQEKSCRQRPVPRWSCRCSTTKRDVEVSEAVFLRFVMPARIKGSIRCLLGIGDRRSHRQRLARRLCAGVRRPEGDPLRDDLAQRGPGARLVPQRCAASTCRGGTRGITATGLRVIGAPRPLSSVGNQSKPRGAEAAGSDALKQHFNQKMTAFVAEGGTGWHRNRLRTAKRGGSLGMRRRAGQASGLSLKCTSTRGCGLTT